MPFVGKSLDKQFGRFLRERRGDVSYAVFARRLGISASTLYRLETGEQSVTLGKLEDVLKRLKSGVRDVFPE
ncbi:MAG: XRE family transcriptional regulator [Acidobacteriia bacterium]|nr:XRE family transcriptional regulator [Terriglobia bacterium]